MSNPPILRFAVISDLHIGSKARAAELCPLTLSDTLMASRDEKFLDAFQRFASSENFLALGRIDALFVTGDITNSGHANEHARASEVMAFIAARLGIGADQTFLVPGNHDVFWPVAKLEPRDFWRRYRYEPLHAKANHFISSTMAQGAAGQFHDEPYAILRKQGALLVLGVNTAAHDGPDEPNVHHGSISAETLSWIDENLAQFDDDSTLRRVCLVHHHPLQYENPTRNGKDFSALQNAEKLLSVLTKHRVEILVHGHRHVPQWTFRMDGNGGHPIGILGAGSFCAALENPWTGNVSNQFHVIECNTLTKAVGRGGRVFSWAYDSLNGWKPSSQDLGIHAVRRFGDRRSECELVSRIEQHLSSHCGKPVIRFSTLESTDADLEYCDDELLVRACRRAAENLKLDFVGEVGGSNERKPWLFLEKAAT
ncbi:MAG: metallophosphoesterase [Casimicrobium sp.]